MDEEEAEVERLGSLLKPSYGSFKEHGKKPKDVSVMSNKAQLAHEFMASGSGTDLEASSRSTRLELRHEMGLVIRKSTRLSHSQVAQQQLVSFFSSFFLNDFI